MVYRCFLKRGSIQNKLLNVTVTCAGMCDDLIILDLSFFTKTHLFTSVFVFSIREKARKTHMCLCSL